MVLNSSVPKHINILFFISKTFCMDYIQNISFV